MTDHFGSCLCGSVKFKIRGGFDHFFLCHCQRCQKDTGSAHAANLFSQTAELTWLSGVDDITTFTLPDTRHSKSFCRHCGSAVPSALMPGLLVVPAGCLDTPVAMAPDAHICMADKAEWDEGLAQVAVLDGLPK